ncbi:MAG: hypothetical protein ABI401_13770 [Candidatus Dormibacter sp.]
MRTLSGLRPIRCPDNARSNLLRGLIASYLLLTAARLAAAWLATRLVGLPAGLALSGEAAALLAGLLLAATLFAGLLLAATLLTRLLLAATLLARLGLTDVFACMVTHSSSCKSETPRWPEPYPLGLMKSTISGISNVPWSCRVRGPLERATLGIVLG